MTKQKRQLLRMMQMLLATAYLLLVFYLGFSSSLHTVIATIIIVVAILMNHIPEKTQQFKPLFFKYYWQDAVVEFILVAVLTVLLLKVLR